MKDDINERSVLCTPHAEESRPAYAGFGRRIGAFIFDWTLLGLMLLTTAMALNLLRTIGVWHRTPHNIDPRPPLELWAALGPATKLVACVNFIISLGPLYFGLLEASPCQATLGKRLLSIYVAQDNGQQMSFGRSLGRWAAKAFFNYFGLSLASIVTIAATEQKKGLHDYVAGTVVLSGRATGEGMFGAWRLAAALVLPLVWLVITFALVL